MHAHDEGGADGNCNGTALFELLVFPGRASPAIAEGVTMAGLRSAVKHVKRLMSMMDTSGYVPGNESLREDIVGLRIAADMTVLACHMGQALLRIGKEYTIAALPTTQRTDLANRLIPLVDRLVAHWRMQNRDGGIVQTQAILQHSIDQLTGTSSVNVGTGGLTAAIS